MPSVLMEGEVLFIYEGGNKSEMNAKPFFLKKKKMFIEWAGA